MILESSDEEPDSEEEEEEEQDSDSEDDVELGGGRGGGTRRLKTREQQEIDLNEDSEPEEEEVNANLILPTRRIAIVNLDWDNLKPIDIYKVFSSLLITPIHNNQQPSIDNNKTTTTMSTDQITKIVEGRVERVRFYKSQFGKERMSKEDIEGPPREIFNSKSKSQINHSVSQEEEEEDSENDDEDLIDEDRGGEFDEDALRQYQLDRLRYFYAIVELDSIHSSKHVFSEIDGTEFERTANIFDLRFVFHIYIYIYISVFLIIQIAHWFSFL